MARGPLGNRRLTTVGPFTYDEESPPELPRGFSPPDEITNATGDFRWWTNWEGKSVLERGATILYDVNADRVIIENRLSGPNGGTYTHDDMVVDLIEKSPFPRFPVKTVAGEGGTVEVAGELRSSYEFPTRAGGAFVTTKRLSEDKEIIEDGERVETEWFYKTVYALKMVDFSRDATVFMRHQLGPRAGQIFKARREFIMEDAYKMLQFDGMLPEVKV